MYFGNIAVTETNVNVWWPFNRKKHVDTKGFDARHTQSALLFGRMGTKSIDAKSLTTLCADYSAG